MLLPFTRLLADAYFLCVVPGCNQVQRKKSLPMTISTQLRRHNLLQPLALFACLFLILPALIGQTPPKKTDPQQPMGGVSTGAPVNYTSRRTVGITDPRAPVVFEDVTDKTAMAGFKHRSGTPTKDYIFEVPSGAVAMFDYDGYGL